MNILATINPYTCTAQIYIFLPSCQTDNYRDMDDVARNMRPRDLEEEAWSAEFIPPVGDRKLVRNELRTP